MKLSGFQLGVIKKCRKRDLDPKRPKHRVCLYTKDGKRLLGRHRSHESALRQERVIQMRKRGRRRIAGRK